MELTRRYALAGAAALAASPLLSNAPARAAAPAADKQAPSFYRYKVGDAQVTAVSDGVNNFALPDTFVLNVKKDEVNAALEKSFMPKDKMSIQFAPLTPVASWSWSTPATARPPLRRARAMSGSSPPIWWRRVSIPRRSTW
jgi:hypothetical protein